MIFRQRFLQGIADGSITLAFRRWIRPTVKTDGTLRTAIGVVRIHEVSRAARGAISEGDARAAGYPSLPALLTDLDKRAEGELYRIAVSLEGPDPRVALREQSDLSDSDFGDLRARLERLDARARSPWTRDVLAMIAARPGLPAGVLARALGRETLDFKRDVRKLKELGLTESLTVGYRISPRGQAFGRVEEDWRKPVKGYPPNDRE